MQVNAGLGGFRRLSYCIAGARAAGVRSGHPPEEGEGSPVTFHKRILEWQAAHPTITWIVWGIVWGIVWAIMLALLFWPRTTE